MSTFGLRFPTIAGDIITSSETYNLHCLGQATFFSSQRFQGFPPTQYDNFFVTSETAPIPFIVHRPGRYSTVLSVARSATPGNWNIVILTAGGSDNAISAAGGGAEYPQITAAYSARYNFAFNYDAPPQVLCFAKLPSDAAASGSIGMALWDSAGNLAFDTGRGPLDPEYITEVTPPTPETQFGNWGISGVKKYTTPAPGAAYVPGHVFINIGGGGLYPVNVFRYLVTSSTAVGSMPANPAFFYAADAESAAGATTDPQLTPGTVGSIYPTFQQNYVPAVTLSGSSAEVTWASRATVIKYVVHGTTRSTGWVRRIGPAPLMIIDADRYL